MLDTISSVNAPELDSRRSHALAVVMTMSNLLQNGGCCNASACDFFTCCLFMVSVTSDARLADLMTETDE